MWVGGLGGPGDKVATVRVQSPGSNYYDPCNSCFIPKTRIPASLMTRSCSSLKSNKVVPTTNYSVLPSNKDVPSTTKAVVSGGLLPPNLLHKKRETQA
jgi:hypothetical protein